MHVWLRWRGYWYEWRNEKKQEQRLKPEATDRHGGKVSDRSRTVWNIIIIIITVLECRTDDKGLFGLSAVLVIPGGSTGRVDGACACAEQRRLGFTQWGSAPAARGPGGGQKPVQWVLATPTAKQHQQEDRSQPEEPQTPHMAPPTSQRERTEGNVWKVFKNGRLLTDTTNIELESQRFRKCFLQRPLFDCPHSNSFTAVDSNLRFKSLHFPDCDKLHAPQF